MYLNKTASKLEAVLFLCIIRCITSILCAYLNYHSTVKRVLSYGAFAVLGLFSAVFVVLIAARRSTRQPVSFSKENEEKLITLLIKDPSLYIRVLELKPSDFAFPQNSQLYASLKELYETLDYDYSSVNPTNVEVKAVEFSDYVTKNLQFIESFNEISENILKENTNINKFYEKSFEEEDKIAAPDDTEKASTGRTSLFKKLLATDSAEGNKSENSSVDLVLEYGKSILDASYDRTIYNGTSVIEFIDKGDDSTLIRVYASPTKFRLFFAAIYGLLTFPLALLLADNSPYGYPGFWFVAVSFALLSLFTLLWAVVDLDTMYLDMQSFTIGFILIAVTSFAAALASDNLALLIPGVAIALGGFLMFEAANFLYRIFRQRDGLGFGDTLILLASAGAPAALLSSFTVGFRSMFFAFILGLLGWFFLFVRKKVSRETPFAFGPYLAFGWIAASLMYLMDKGVI